MLDKRYTYATKGYNLMCSEIHAAIGVEQLKKLDMFVTTRHANWEMVNGALAEQKDLLAPRVESNVKPVWFGYPIIRHPEAKWSKIQFMKYLELNGIETRSIYGGAVIDQYAYQDETNYRISGRLVNSEYLTENAFWVSCWHGLKVADVSFLNEQLLKFLSENT
jgi:CDP-6-deoxy-D-xylo-4-hexulose-3-dehydrase